MIQTVDNLHEVYPFRIPIAARTLNGIHRLIGNYEVVRSSGVTANAVQVFQCQGHQSKLPDNFKKYRSSWRLIEESHVWVHVDFRDYRKAYADCRNDEDISGFYIDHILNRRWARKNGFNYLRLCPVSPSVNSSGGRGLETFNVKHYGDISTGDISSQEGPDSNCYESEIGYATPLAICKMLDIMPGKTESLGGIQGVYAALHGH